jgi:hypothetical protein
MVSGRLKVLPVWSSPGTLQSIEAGYLQSAGFIHGAPTRFLCLSQHIDIYEFILIIWIYLERSRGALQRFSARNGH